MSKRAEEMANELFPEPKLENYDDILIYRADRDNAIMGRAMCYKVYEQAEKDLSWHPSTEHPPVDEEVIVLLSEWNEVSIAPLYRITFGHVVNKEYCEDFSGWNIPGVKYWMPMPEIPKEDKR